MTAAHTSKYYETELRTLREKLLLMGSLAEEMIEKGVVALNKRDSALAAETIKIDRRINRLECEVDELCMRILATRQPVASDLRFITIALKTVTDLERIGDLGRQHLRAGGRAQRGAAPHDERRRRRPRRGDDRDAARVSRRARRSR